MLHIIRQILRQIRIAEIAQRIPVVAHGAQDARKRRVKAQPSLDARRILR